MKKIKKFEKFNQDIDAKDIPTFIKKYGVEDLQQSDELKHIDLICRDLKLKNYTINKDGSVDVDEDVDLPGLDLYELPIKFGIVKGRFNVSANNLDSFENFPKMSDELSFINNNFKSLIGLPKSKSYNIFNLGKDRNPLTNWDVKVFLHFVAVKMDLSKLNEISEAKCYPGFLEKKASRIPIDKKTLIDGYANKLVNWMIRDESHEIWDWYTDYVESYEDLNNLQSRLEIITGKLYGEDLFEFKLYEEIVNRSLELYYGKD